MAVQRFEVVQGLLDLQENPTYLEIGVNEGETFNAVRARRKVAVDPQFKFPAHDSSDNGALVEFHEVESDKYFGSIVSKIDRFDLVYLDGLHVFEQTLRDLLSAIVYLKPNGIILVDDVIPTSYIAAIPSLHEFTLARLAQVELNPTLALEASWMGDIYKIPLFVQTFLQQFSYATISDNHGQTVIWRQSRARPVARGMVDLAGLEYKGLLLAKEALNLHTFETIISMIRQARLRG